jgi:uncharacterized membrane protein
MFYPKARAWTVLEASRAVITKHFGSALVLFLILAAIMLVSILPLGLGLIYTLPVVLAVLYVAAKDLYKAGVLNTDDELL